MKNYINWCISRVSFQAFTKLCFAMFYGHV